MQSTVKSVDFEPMFDVNFFKEVERVGDSDLA